MISLPTIWFCIIAFEIGLYILLDGADLGIGMLSLFKKEEAPSGTSRALIMQVIGPIWDANETWLVIAGGTLFGAFPLAYGVMLNALYIPVMILIFGIIIRAASFEFHEYGENKRLWGVLFGIGSVLSVLGQGLMAGGLLSGIAVTGTSFSGSLFDFATPVAFLVAFLLMGAYMLMGYAYLAQKGVAGYARAAWLYPVMLVALATAFIGVTLLLMPYIAPPYITIYKAAASPATLRFMLWGIGPLLPIVLAYNFYLYRVFSSERAEARMTKGV